MQRNQGDAVDRFRLSLTSDAPPDMVVSVQAGEPPEYCFRVWQFQERAAYDVFIEGDGKLLIGRLAQPNIGSRQPTEAINQDVGVQQYDCRDCFHACSRSVRARVGLSAKSVR